MNNNILYISIFDTNNYYDCFGLLSQFKDNMLCLFSSDELYHLCQPKISSYGAKCRIIRDFNLSLWNIIKDYNNKYNAFGLIHNTKTIYYENNSPILVKNKILQIYDSDSLLLSFYDNQLLINLHKTNINIQDLLLNNCILNQDVEKIKNHYYKTYIHKTENNTVINEKNFENVYENDLCAFVTIEKLNGVNKSAVFINKRNMKAYHIDSLLAGNVLNLTQNSFVVDWQINNESVYCAY